ncbi:YdcF family protein [Roseospirillum parvum]|uniref:Uncharacterized SAM-binding protein YcdF, DUF218 family n=1 Tax=Roseospirillum parvum TaxID=83401 RepID=A0A1G7Y7G6_9PROT|nr:YdcF family protein [Roseospirillum parvum]SDG92364.1 Uncharacterized SAM-binding protein YcdF, DUF218 family [Roseospirillum parvum]
MDLDPTYLLAKLARPLTDLEGLLSLLLVLAVIGLFIGRFQRVARRVLACLMGVGLLGNALPLGPWLALPLETRFPIPERLPERIDGIVVLGGYMNLAATELSGQPQADGAIDRLLVGLTLAQQHPQARVVLSGGAGDPFDQSRREADLAAGVIARLYPDTPDLGGRLVIERESRNTRENALFSHRMATPQPGENWVLVTSALHMPRAVGSFRAAGWTVLPYPVDHNHAFRPPAVVRWPRLPHSLLPGVNTALEAWAGLVWYRARGYMTTLVPGPDPT